jgi:anti-anti-sigma regulatory factor
VDERTTGACPAVPVDGPVSVSVHRPNQDLVLMQVRGDVDDAAAADLGRRLTAAATPGADAQVALDLAGVTALSRAGLDAILQAQESLEVGSLELL